MSRITRGLLALSCVAVLTWSVNLVAAVDLNDQVSGDLAAERQGDTGFALSGDGVVLGAVASEVPVSSENGIALSTVGPDGSVLTGTGSEVSTVGTDVFAFGLDADIADIAVAGISASQARPDRSTTTSRPAHPATTRPVRPPTGDSTTTTVPSSTSTVPVTTTTKPPVTTTTVAVTTTTVPVTTTTVGGGGGAPPGSVVLKPGDPVVSIVAGAASGTTFWFSAGTYSGLSIQPKANQVFLGADGAVLAGNGKAYAFRSGAANVTISGLVIEGYQSAEKEAAINPDGGAVNWVVTGNEIRYNSEVGVKVNTGWQVVGNFIHHNGRYGINGSGSGVLVADNEISYNATEYGATGSSGGTKFVITTGLVLRGNYSHHNYGNGLWVDINNVNVLIENNTVVANERNGIFLEISCGGVIRNNYVEGNGTVPKLPNWMGGSSGILVSMTPNVDVYGNTLVGNDKGIGALNWDHPNVGAVTNCVPELRNLEVYSNSITQNGGAAAGIEAPVQTDNVLNNWGNQFYSNTYILSGGAEFRLEGAWISLQTWTNAGFN
jgi:parallel beta-helix repeat protein